MTAPQKAITGLGYDPDFGGIDLSGCPSIQQKPSDSNWIDDRFAMDETGQGHEINALKRFIAEQAAESEGPSTVVASGHRFRITYHSGAYHAEGMIDGERHRYTATDREALLGKIGQAIKPANPYRALTQNEELQVVRACQSGDKLTAIGTYLRFAIGEARASQYNSPLEMMHDAALIPVMNACAEFTWYHSHPHALDTPEWHTYKDEILAGRPITFDLLDAIWLRYQNYLESESRSALLGKLEAPEPEEENPRDTLAELNELDDSAVDKLMHATQRQHAREVRAGQR